MNSDINTLKTKLNELTGTLYHTETNESGETVNVLNKFTNGNLSGEDWATSLQKINEFWSYCFNVSIYYMFFLFIRNIILYLTYI